MFKHLGIIIRVKKICSSMAKEFDFLSGSFIADINYMYISDIFVR